MSVPQPRDPRRSADTRAAYRKRFEQLWAKAKVDLGSPFTIMQFAQWNIKLFGSLAPASIRQYRAAVAYGFDIFVQRSEGLREEIERARQLLNGDEVDEAKQPVVARTSATKAKTLNDKDFEKIIAAATISRSRFASDLIAYARANIVVGLRPIEWWGTTLEQANSSVTVLVANAKASNDRAHGEFRSLRFGSISRADAADMLRWSQRVQELSSKQEYSALLKRMEELLRSLCQDLFPRRHLRPTLSTFRHAVSARWKLHFIADAKTPEERVAGARAVAALMGHAADDTAHKHYGRAPRVRSGGGRSYPVPIPNPAEVAEIRPRLQERREKLEKMLSERTSSSEFCR